MIQSYTFFPDNSKKIFFTYFWSRQNLDNILVNSSCDKFSWSEPIVVMLSSIDVCFHWDLHFFENDYYHPSSNIFVESEKDADDKGR